MQSYSPELIQTMRAALEEVMTKIPLEQATPGIKAALAGGLGEVLTTPSRAPSDKNHGAVHPTSLRGGGRKLTDLRSDNSCGSYLTKPQGSHLRTPQVPPCRAWTRL